MELECFLDGKKSNNPIEYRGFELEVNFEDEFEIRTTLAVDKITFALNEADVINNYLTAGTTGGLGVFYGIPLQFKISGLTIFDGYVDLTEFPEFSCEKVIVKIREADKFDWIEANADGFGFDYLEYSGLITANDFVKVPYVLNDVPDYKSAGLFLISSFVIGREIYNIIEQLSSIFGDLAGYFTIIAAIVKLIFYIAFLILLIIALVKLIKQIIEELVPFVRFHKAMSVKKHFEKGCQRLGKTFYSSLFDSTIPTDNELQSGLWENLYILPPKYEKGSLRGRQNNQKGYWDVTFGDFLRAMQNVFNAKITVTKTALRFERVDYSNAKNVYKIPDVRRDFNGINSDKLVSNYLVQFQVDNVDLNTINRYNGTVAKNYIEPKIVDNTKQYLIKGFKQPTIPFALGKRKNNLTRLEGLLVPFLKLVDKIFDPVFKLITSITGAMNKAVGFMNKIIKAVKTIGINIPLIKSVNTNVSKPSFANLILSRIGMLELTNDLTSVPKLILLEGSGDNVKVTTDNETKLTAANLWNSYHYIESMVPTTNRPTGNQKYIYEVSGVPFCLADYNLIIGDENNGQAKILSPEGNNAKILSLKWNIWNNTAYIKYEEDKLYTTNIKETLLINTGL